MTQEIFEKIDALYEEFKADPSTKNKESLLGKLPNKIRTELIKDKPFNYSEKFKNIESLNNELDLINISLNWRF